MQLQNATKLAAQESARQGILQAQALKQQKEIAELQSKAQVIQAFSSQTPEMMQSALGMLYGAPATKAHSDQAEQIKSAQQHQQRWGSVSAAFASGQARINEALKTYDEFLSQIDRLRQYPDFKKKMDDRLKELQKQHPEAAAQIRNRFRDYPKSIYYDPTSIQSTKNKKDGRVKVIMH